MVSGGELGCPREHEWAWRYRRQWSCREGCSCSSEARALDRVRADEEASTKSADPWALEKAALERERKGAVAKREAATKSKAKALACGHDAQKTSSGSAATWALEKVKLVRVGDEAMAKAERIDTELARARSQLEGLRRFVRLTRRCRKWCRTLRCE